MNRQELPSYRIVLKELGMSDTDARSAAPIVRTIYLKDVYEHREKNMPRGLAELIRRQFVSANGRQYRLSQQMQGILNKTFEAKK